MNDLPDILPTGVMASGTYVDYMFTYNDAAADVISDNIDEVQAMSTIEDWYDLWVRVLEEVDTRITSIESSITSLNQQIRAIDSKIKSL